MHIAEFKDQTNFTSRNFLHINSCGFQQFSCDQETILRSKGRQDYQLIYVTKGYLLAYTEGEEQTLAPGDLLLYRPHEKQQYRGLAGSESYWVHFTGIGVENLLSLSGLQQTKVTAIGTNPVLSRLFDCIISHFKSDAPNLLAISFLIQFCASASPVNAEGLHTDKRISPALGHMNRHYNTDKPLSFYADLCHLSETRFSHIFKEIMHIPPHRYVLQLRLNRVKYLLTYTDLSLGEIAAATGFKDPLYLSRLFKKNFGISLSEWRSL